MNKVEALAYRQETAELLLSEPSPQERRAFLAAERKTPKYQEAKLIYTSGIREKRESRMLEQDAEEAPTKTQQDIVWANSVLEDYGNLPQEQRGRNKSVKRFLYQATSGLLEDPERLETAIGVWRAHADEGDLYEQVSEKLTRDVEKGWRGITPDQLALFTRSYARNGSASEFAGKALARYFKGPQDIKERVDAYYQFMDGVLNLVEDPVALTEGVRISGFETEILSRKSQVYRDIEIAQLYSMYDPAIPIRAAAADYTWTMLLSYTDLDKKEILARHRAEENRVFALDATQDIVDQEVRKSKRVWGEEAVEEAFANFTDSTTTHGDIARDVYQGLGVPTRDYGTDLHSRSLQKAAEDPLYQKTQKIFPLFLSKMIRREAVKSLAFDANDTPLSKSISLPDRPYIMDLTLPQSLHSKFGKVLESALTEIDARGLSVDNPVSWLDSNLDGKPYFVFIRQPVESEGKRHSLELLNEIGFPVISRTEPSLQVENQVLVEHITQAPIRFLNARGVHVPLDHPELKNLGYEAVEFYKDTNDTQKTRVKLHVGGAVVAFKLDKFLKFDFEGQSCDISAIEDSLRYTILSILYPLLCEESIYTERGETIDFTKQFIGRAGHLRFLQPGQNHSQDQIDACLKYEQKDLRALNEERKRKLGTDINSTYVRPTVYEDAGLPPARINIPLYLQYSVPQGETN